MARGKYERVAKHGSKNKKALSLILSIALLLTIAAGGTLAYITAKSNVAENQFVPGKVVCTVNGNGTVTNGPGSNVNAFIRAAVVVSWMDSSGNVYAIKPSYSVSTNADWAPSGDFYYYNTSVAPGDATATAPVTVTVLDSAPSDAYSLRIEIVAEAIQAEGMGASNAQEAWAKAQAGS